ncbi:pilus assembly protein [Cupriavidus sp. 8B]
MLITLCALPSYPGAVQGAAAAPVQLSYIAGPGDHPWSGRLLALALPPGDRAAMQSWRQPAWEAGALLDMREPDSRQLFTARDDADGAPSYLAPLRLDALAASTRKLRERAGFHDRPDGHSRQRLAQLGHPGSASPVLVPPPAWIPGRPGHAAFATRHGARRALVWMGTRDGLLHAFDAGSGEEVLAYLPGTLLVQAAQAARAPPVVPCPFPEAADVALEPERWRTVLLCGIPASMPDESQHAGQAAQAGVFALDITNTAAQPPLNLLWEAKASDAFPLAPAGPIRALALGTREGQRWYAMVAMAAVPGDESQSDKMPRGRPSRQAGLALLPLDKPARASWEGRYAVSQLHLPASGCGTDGAYPPLLAATILPDFSGAAVAAYAVDAAGRLWRFDLRGEPPWHDSESRVRCMHRVQGQTLSPRLPPPGGTAAASVPAPVIVSAREGHLVVYGSGNHVTAVFDSATLADTGKTSRQPGRIVAQARESGVVLRRQPCRPDCQDAAGWHLRLPNPDERLDRTLPADPGYLGFVTRTPDARQRIYMVHALSGESTTSDQAGGPLVHATTGLAAGAGATVVLGRALLPPVRSPQPGASSREAFALTMWSLEDGRAVPHNRTVASRRTGRLRWRELIRSGSP